MAYVAINRTGQEFIFEDKPEYNRVEDRWEEETGIDEIVYADPWDHSAGCKGQEYMSPGIELPKGTIEKIIGKRLTFADEPYKLD